MKRVLAIFLLSGLLSSSALAQQWMWEDGKQSIDGSISVKSLSDGATQNLAQNPTGAIAKVDQNAVTQPPTIIVQQTSGGDYGEAIPILASGNSVPMCPAGYSSAWQKSSSGCQSTIYNLGGTRFSLAKKHNPSNGRIYLRIVADNFPADGSSADELICDTGVSWAVNVCTK